MERLRCYFGFFVVRLEIERVKECPDEGEVAKQTFSLLDGLSATWLRDRMRDGFLAGLLSVELVLKQKRESLDR